MSNGGRRPTPAEVDQMQVRELFQRIAALQPKPMTGKRFVRLCVLPFLSGVLIVWIPFVLWIKP